MTEPLLDDDRPWVLTSPEDRAGYLVSLASRCDESEAWEEQ
jgi:hypothetical protein